MVDARNSDAVTKLRMRKGRYEKPFAVMFPTLKQVQLACEVNDVEQQLLISAESPNCCSDIVAILSPPEVAARKSLSWCNASLHAAAPSFAERP